MNDPRDPFIVPPDVGTPTPNTPTDLFSTEVSPVLDEARQIIADQGLRPYRAFLVISKYDGTGRREGNLLEREVRELLPPPMVKHFSTVQVAMSGGFLQQGDVLLDQVSRVYTKHELRGRGVVGDPLPRAWDFAIALQEIGSLQAKLYNPASDPVLKPTAWELVVRPRNEDIVLVTP